MGGKFWQDRISPKFFSIIILAKCYYKSTRRAAPLREPEIPQRRSVGCPLLAIGRRTDALRPRDEKGGGHPAPRKRFWGILAQN